MPFAASDFREWLRVLYDHPEWREELRQLVLTDELLRLPEAVRGLIEAHRRAEERLTRLEEGMANLQAAVAALNEAQRRSEERLTRLETAVAELAEAQRRSEERLTRLETAVAELAEAQRRTEQRVEELAEAQSRLGVAVGELQRAFGSTVEEEAASVAEVIMRRKGYHIVQPAYSLALDGEIDVVLPLEDATGRPVWVVVEAKARLSQRDVHRWSSRMHSAEWHKRLIDRGVKGPYLVYAYSIRADLGAQEMAEKAGIGLLKSDGEVLAPRGLIEPLHAQG